MTTTKSPRPQTYLEAKASEQVRQALLLVKRAQQSIQIGGLDKQALRIADSKLKEAFDIIREANRPFDRLGQRDSILTNASGLVNAARRLLRKTEQLNPKVWPPPGNVSRQMFAMLKEAQPIMVKAREWLGDR